MNSRRVHRVFAARRKAVDALETYRVSSRGLNRVFKWLLRGEHPSTGLAASRASHHLAEVERMLPTLREAIRSCRYPGAEHGDPAALLWGLWGQLSEAQLHMRGALQSLEVLGQRYRYRDEKAAVAEIRAAATGRPRRKPASGTGRRPRGRSV